jgi:hypothetical protein
MIINQLSSYTIFALQENARAEFKSGPLWASFRPLE